MASFPIVRADASIGRMPEANANWGSILSSVLPSFEQGQQYAERLGIQQGRREVGQQGIPRNADGTPDYMTPAQRLLAIGDLEGSNNYLRLGQQETQNNFERQKLDIMRQRAGTSEQPKYGLNPQFGVDAQGNPVVLQPGTNGQMIRSQMPPGVTISNKPIQLDAGTHFVLLDPITRQPIGTVPKNVAGAAAEKAQGTAAGEAQAALPAAQGIAAQINKNIDDLAADPYLPSMVGPWASKMPNVSADAARVQSRMDQLGGGAFLQARQMLKGGGAITDYEGKKAEEAFARLNAAQSLPDYLAALNEFKGALGAGLAKLQGQAGAVPGAGQNFGAPGGAPGASAPQAQGGDQLAQARAAIARGARRDAVIQRLQQMGINPAGL
ncbi:hypothetical protein [Xanthobacter sp. VNH20]|uniref:hypothetical protein n=1 Tax=Xanthobacter sp. VNH20 TaxID=3156616 RepID=UPI0032B3529B